MHAECVTVFPTLARVLIPKHRKGTPIWGTAKPKVLNIAIQIALSSFPKVLPYGLFGNLRALVGKAKTRCLNTH